jgi:hypothetical protein
MVMGRRSRYRVLGERDARPASELLRIGLGRRGTKSRRRCRVPTTGCERGMRNARWEFAGTRRGERYPESWPRTNEGQGVGLGVGGEVRPRALESGRDGDRMG